jgi:hypothetical protein
MPRLIDPGPVPSPLGPEEAVATLEAMRFNPQAPGAWDEAAPVLAALSADRGFLGRRAVAILAGRGGGEGAFRYGPQVVMLHVGTGWFLRANLWPTADDPLLRASGRRAFFYDVPHDHNFDFLTIGHHGPGYESDYWTYSPDEVIGLPGEPVALRFAGRRRLTPGRTMLYRARRDIHDQKPPARFSISLNIVAATGRHAWCDQYRFDPARGRILGTLNTPALAGLVALAAHVGGGDGRDLVEHVARCHPVDRIRFGAIRALAGAAATEAERITILEEAAGRGDRYVSILATRALERAGAVARWAAPDDP